MRHRIRTTIFIITLALFLPLKSHAAFVMRNAGDMMLGFTGGYGFPQLATMKNLASKSPKITGGKEYYFGMNFSYFATNALAINFESHIKYKRSEYTFNYGTDSEIKNTFDTHIISFNVEAQYYWFDMMYLGAGFFMDVPFGKPNTNLADYKNNALVNGGALVEFGVDMRVLKPLSIRIAIRFVLPFSPMLSFDHNNYESYSLPADLVFGLEWDF